MPKFYAFAPCLCGCENTVSAIVEARDEKSAIAAFTGSFHVLKSGAVAFDALTLRDLARELDSDAAPTIAEKTTK